MNQLTPFWQFCLNIPFNFNVIYARLFDHETQHHDGNINNYCFHGTNIQSLCLQLQNQQYVRYTRAITMKKLMKTWPMLIFIKLLFVNALLGCHYILNWTPFCVNLQPYAPSIQKLSPNQKHAINSFSLNKTQHNEMLKIVNCTCCNIQNTLEQLNYWHITTLYTSRTRLSESAIFCFSLYYSYLIHCTV